MNKYKLIIVLFIVLGLIIGYGLFGLYFYINQRSFVYFPSKQDFHSCEGFSDYQKVDNGTRFYFLKNSSSHVIIFYHGNAGSACDRSVLRPLFEQSDASLIFVEYSGFSNDDKKPSKDAIYKDVENINKFIQEEGFTEVSVVGESIGSGAATFHAKIGSVQKVLLISPFATMASFAQSIYPYYPVKLLLKEDYNNITNLQEYTGTVVILHGEQDEVIGIKFSKDLYDTISSDITKDRKIIKNAGHNDLYRNSDFKKEILKFIGAS